MGLGTKRMHRFCFIVYSRQQVPLFLAPHLGNALSLYRERRISPFRTSVEEQGVGDALRKTNGSSTNELSQVPDIEWNEYKSKTFNA